MKTLGGVVGRLRTEIDRLGDALRGERGEAAVQEQMQQLAERLREWRGLADTLKAQAFTAQERVAAVDAKIALREAQAVAALEAGEAALAREVAEAIVALQAGRVRDVANLEDTAARRVQLDALIEQAENDLRRLRHQLDLLRAAQAVARGEETIRAADGSTGIQTAIDSAELLRARRAAGGEAPATPARPREDDLDARLARAGVAVPSPVDAVLTRLAERVAPALKPRRRSARKDTP